MKKLSLFVTGVIWILIIILTTVKVFAFFEHSIAGNIYLIITVLVCFFTYLYKMLNSCEKKYYFD